MSKFTITDLAKLGYRLEGDTAVKAGCCPEIRGHGNLLQEKKANKFNARRTVYRGETYDSKKEAAYAAQLDLQRSLSKPGLKVVSVARQVPYEIRINDNLVCTYYLDFMVRYADNRLEHVDVKGLKKGAAYDLFRLKKKLVEAQHGIKIIEK